MAGEPFSYLNISRDVTGPKEDRRVWMFIRRPSGSLIKVELGLHDLAKLTTDAARMLHLEVTQGSSDDAR